MARSLTLCLLGALVACDAADGGSLETDDGTSTSTGAVSSSSSTDPGITGGSTSNPAPETTGGGEDGSTSAHGSTGSPPEGVPVIVSIAHGGQTARSCDGGQSWHDFNAFGIQDDHSDYAAFGGITFGNGAFVAATGWGADARVLRSTDGITWEDLPDEAFISETGGRPSNGASGVEFVGGDFVLFAGGGLWRSPDGTTWTRSTTDNLDAAGNIREVEYLPSLDRLVVVMEGWDATGWVVQTSDDGGHTWSVGTGATAACIGFVQHNGGLAAHDGRILLAGGDGPVCVSDDGGLTWSEAGTLGAGVADVGSSPEGFFALTWSGELRHSEDGLTWSTSGSTGLAEGRLDWHEAFGFFGEGPGYVHSSDGVSWAPSRTTPPSGFGGVREFSAGIIAPEHSCF
ncbi:MAG: hypothetical protein AAGA54_26595 [Myxococcota bacterium]